jgi:Na+-transporting NADH:ubiquinone oxidoreductase subunit B
MKFLRDQIDKIKPTFSEGGKLSFLHSTFDAFETFLFVPNHTTQNGAHIRDGVDLKANYVHSCYCYACQHYCSVYGMLDTNSHLQ